MTQIHEERWPNITRLMDYGRVKTGYKVSDTDKKLLVPDWEVIKYLEQGFDFLEKGSSSREVSEWLSQKILTTISHQAVLNLYKANRKPFVRTKTAKRTRPKLSKDAVKILSAKRTARWAEKKAQDLEKEIMAKRASGKIQPEDYDIPPVPKVRSSSGDLNLPPVPKEVSIIFQPNPGPQSDFLASTESEVLYGGGAGGKLKSEFLCLLSS